LFEQALALQQQNRPHDAEPLFRSAHELAPRDADMLHRFGTCLFSLGNLAAATAALRKAIELRPFEPALLDSMGGWRFLLPNVATRPLLVSKGH